MYLSFNQLELIATTRRDTSDYHSIRSQTTNKTGMAHNTSHSPSSTASHHTSTPPPAHRTEAKRTREMSTRERVTTQRRDHAETAERTLCLSFIPARTDRNIPAELQKREEHRTNTIQWEAPNAKHALNTEVVHPTRNPTRRLMARLLRLRAIPPS